LKEINEEFFEKMYRRLDKGLPSYLTYHNVPHTQYVLDKAVFLAKKEGCNEKEIQLISVAALYHDAGFLIRRENHEALGCDLVREELPEMGFNSEEIVTICGMIMATKVVQNPQNKLERILVDADLFYLGTADYFHFSGLLKTELLHFNPSLDEVQWRNIQIDFLTAHRYYTGYGVQQLDPIKQKNIDLILVS
jgi:uncharacterized protein